MARGIRGVGVSPSPHLPISPSVLIEEVASRQLVAVGCERARALGVRPGMTLAQARALCPGGGLAHADHDPAADRRALDALARWMMARFSPTVAPEPPGAVFLDVTGSERLFGGTEALARLVAGALARLGVAARVAVAPTPGAAWALAAAGAADVYVDGGGDACVARDAARAHVGATPASPGTWTGEPRGAANATHPRPEPDGCDRGTASFPRQQTGDAGVAPTGAAETCLQDRRSGDAGVAPTGTGANPRTADRATQASPLHGLPAWSLRLDPATAATLHHLGIETVGQLLALPRDALAARFGPALLRRVDQALGRCPEVLVPLAHQTPVRARLAFDGAVDSLEAIWLAFKELIGRVIAQLARRGLGARQVDVEFRQALRPPVRRTIYLSRPSRDAGNLFNLLRCATEQVRSDDGFTEVRLSVPVTERTSDAQGLLLGGEEQAAAAELAHLVERLAVRLGREAVVRAEPRESHLPERAYAHVGVTGVVPGRESARPPKAKKKRRTTVVPPAPPGVSDRRGARPTGAADRAGPTPAGAVMSIVPGYWPFRNPGVLAGQRPGDAGVAPTVNRHVLAEPRSGDAGVAPTRAVPTDAWFGRADEVDDPPPRADDTDPKHAPAAARPLHLLAVPTEIAVTAAPSHDGDGRPLTFARRGGGAAHRLRHATGPERIDGVWWEGRHKTRDYYDVEDERGRRFWIFRVAQTGKWFLHGEYE